MLRSMSGFVGHQDQTRLLFDGLQPIKLFFREGRKLPVPTGAGIGAPIAHADLRTHRTAPFPAQVADKIDTFIAEQSALTWPAPVSGWMGVKVASSA